MFEVVIDTNILVSALWTTHGTASQIVRLIPIRKIVPYYSAAMLREYETVLCRPKFRFPRVLVGALLDDIVKYGTEVVPIKSTIPFSDESDRTFYDTAKTCGAVLITGNARDYPIEEFILAPAEYLSRRGYLQ